VSNGIIANLRFITPKQWFISLRSIQIFKKQLFIKRIKLMLMSFALLAEVGGALAFRIIALEQQLQQL
jgi:hypothetical protein